MQRKTFVCLVGGGAFALGFYGARVDGAAERFMPNQWLRIERDGRINVTLNKAEMGQGVATGFATIVADELDAPFETVVVELAPAEDRYNDPVSGRMSTGGSTSTRDMWMPLRTAAAAARAMLVAAAAKRWGVSPASCSTVSGSVTHAPSGRRLSYAALIDDAGAQPVPPNPPLKSRAQWTLIGKQNRRIDVAGKLDGSTRFGIDVRVPSMLFAVVIRCPVFGGKIRDFDAREALKRKGVRSVHPITSGVAIVADDTWSALSAKPAVRVNWEYGSNAAVDTKGLFQEAERLAKSNSPPSKTRGDVAAAAGIEMSAEYRGPFLAHATMEPMNATAYVRENRCEVWAPTQAPTASREIAQRITGFPLENVTVNVTYLGGGFGRRSETDFVRDAVEISRAARKPVQVVYTREDDIQHDYYRPMSYNLIRGKVDNGAIAALSHTVVTPAPMRMALNSAEPPYAIPNLELRYVVHDRGIPVGQWRAPGANWNVFVVETFVDELAGAAKRDPLEFRLAMLGGTPRAAGVLRLAADRAGWRENLPAGTGRGLALGFWNGTYAALVADVRVEDGAAKVLRAVVAVDCGTIVNPDIVKSQTESAVNYALAATLTSKITIANGRVEQTNFDDYAVLRHRDAPKIDVHIIDSDAAPTGIGEPATPITAPAVANALFSLTGKRIRTLPLTDEVLTVS